MANVSHNRDKVINLTWLNNSFLENVTRSSEDDAELQVTSYEVTLATAPGENYANEIYRIRVECARGGHPETRSFIFKVVPAVFEAFVLQTDIFTRETLAMSSVAPNMYRLLEEASPSKFQPFSPKCVYSQSNPWLIGMEDLKEQGFRLPERSLGLDMKHSMLVMRKLARFHASSAVLNEKHHEIIQPFYDNLECNKLKDVLEAFYAKGMKHFSNEIENWPEYKDRFAAKFHDLVGKTADTLLQIMERDDNEFNALRHGDLWLNNMMFLYSGHTGNVEDVRFLDYPLCHFGSPATDLLYFLYTSVSTDLMDDHPKLLEEYYKTLQETLTSLGYERLTPTKEQLDKQLENISIYGVIISCTVLPVVLADPNYIPNMENVITNEYSIHFSDNYKKTIKKYLKQFEQKGWL